MKDWKDQLESQNYAEILAELKRTKIPRSRDLRRAIYYNGLRVTLAYLKMQPNRKTRPKKKSGYREWLEESRNEDVFQEAVRSVIKAKKRSK